VPDHLASLVGRALLEVLPPLAHEPRPPPTPTQRQKSQKAWQVDYIEQVRREGGWGGGGRGSLELIACCSTLSEQQVAAISVIMRRKTDQSADHARCHCHCYKSLQCTLLLSNSYRTYVITVLKTGRSDDQVRCACHCWPNHTAAAAAAGCRLGRA
jgi:hypothetical protein